MEQNNGVRWGLALLATSVLLTACANVTSGDFAPNRETVLPAEGREFVNLNPKIKMAAAYGDRSKGMHGSFGQFPANFATPFHSHSGAYHAVVIKGVMTNPFVNEADPTEMLPGSYWYVPAQAIHQTACVSEEPCEFYFYAEQAFDFTPVAK